MSTNCLDTNVNTWMNNNCTQKSLEEDQNYWNELFKNFYPNNEIYTDLNEREKIEFQYLLTDLCNLYPNGIYCKQNIRNLCSKYTREDMNNLIIKKMCGCNLPDEEYDKNLGIACDPICTGLGIVKPFDNNGQIYCHTSSCIIDNVKINMIKSTGKDINFNQLCPYCSGTSTCRCIINDVNVLVEKGVVGSLNIYQQCKKENKICYTKDENGYKYEVSCDKYFPELKSTYEKEKTRGYLLLLILILMIIGILIIFGITLYLSLKQKRLDYIYVGEYVENGILDPSKFKVYKSSI